MRSDCLHYFEAVSPDGSHLVRSLYLCRGQRDKYHHGDNSSFLSWAKFLSTFHSGYVKATASSLQSPRRIYQNFIGRAFFFAVAIIDAVNLRQILFVSCEVHAHCTTFSVDGQRVNVTELGHKPVGAIFIVVKVNELCNAEHIFPHGRNRVRRSRPF